MTSEQFARLLAASLAQHQSRGLVDDGFGMLDVVIHGRINLLAVAEDLLSASSESLERPQRSWSPWFVGNVEARRKAARRARLRARLAEQLDRGTTAAEAALVRLRLRDLDL